MARTPAYNFCDEDFSDLRAHGHYALLDIAHTCNVLAHKYSEDLRTSAWASLDTMHSAMRYRLRAEIAREMADGSTYALALTTWLGTAELPKRVK